MDYKQETKRTYETYPEVFDKRFQLHFAKHVQPEADIFISHLNGKKIVDLGCGPGNHADYFRQKGLEVLCIDISEEMVRLCKQKGLRAEVIDFENLELDGQFDGVWAYASLLHIPKNKIQNVVSRIEKVLKQEGILGLSLKEGKGEGFEPHHRFPGTQRWFTYYTDDEIRQLFGRFEVLHSSRTDVYDKYVFLNYVMKYRC